MHLTVLRMLSTNSLQAFSQASTTAPLRHAAPAAPVARLVRSPAEGGTRQAAPLPDAKPSLPLPRGSLLNLSV